MELNVGKQYTFKRASGRGRPFVGEVVQKMGVNVKMRVLRSDELVVVPSRRVLNEYIFRPYNTKAREEV